MRSGVLGRMGGEGKIVEVDETYFGNMPEESRPALKSRGRKFQKGFKPKRTIIALVERGGSIRSFHVAHANQVNVANLVQENLDRESVLHTDESRLYTKVGNQFAAHETVKHSADEYVRGVVHTNTVENVFSVFKRGMRGVYQHCAEKHLHRYLAEFDFRYNARMALGVDDQTPRRPRVEGYRRQAPHLSNSYVRAGNRMASPKRKPKPKQEKDASEKPQSERFKETARKLEADKSGNLFERALRAIVPPRLGRRYKTDESA